MVDIPSMEEIGERYARGSEKGANEYEKHLRRRGKSVREACEETDRYFAGAVNSSGADLNELRRQFSEDSRSRRIVEALIERR